MDYPRFECYAISRAGLCIIAQRVRQLQTVAGNSLSRQVLGRIAGMRRTLSGYVAAAMPFVG
jgi:hypothetical protein